MTGAAGLVVVFAVRVECKTDCAIYNPISDSHGEQGVNEDPAVYPDENTACNHRDALYEIGDHVQRQRTVGLVLMLIRRTFEDIVLQIVANTADEGKEDHHVAYDLTGILEAFYCFKHDPASDEEQKPDINPEGGIAHTMRLGAEFDEYSCQKCDYDGSAVAKNMSRVGEQRKAPRDSPSDDLEDKYRESDPPYSREPPDLAPAIGGVRAVNIMSFHEPLRAGLNLLRS